MAKRGGFPGGMPGTSNLEACSALMEQVDAFVKADKLVAAVCAAPSILGHRGHLKGRKACAVEVTVTGKREVTKVKLSEEVVDPDDVEMLEDLVMAAANEALRMAEEANNEAMSKMTGGLGLGGGLPF